MCTMCVRTCVINAVAAACVRDPAVSAAAAFWCVFESRAHSFGLLFIHNKTNARTCYC